MVVYKIPVIRDTSVSRMLSSAHGARRAIQRSTLPLVMGFGHTIYQDIYRVVSGCFLDYEKHTGKKFSVLYRRSYLHLEQKRFRDPRIVKVISVSQMVKEQIINRYHLAREWIEVVYSGVETLRLKLELKRQKANSFLMATL